MTKSTTPKKYHIILLLFVLCSCSSFRAGTYNSYCLRYGRPAITIAFNDDNTFQYFIQYVDEDVKGTWTKKGKLLILESDFFTREIKDLSIIYQFTEAEKKDIYKIRGNKLLLMSADSSFTKKCYLYKTE